MEPDDAEITVEDRVGVSVPDGGYEGEGCEVAVAGEDDPGRSGGRCEVEDVGDKLEGDVWHRPS